MTTPKALHRATTQTTVASAVATLALLLAACAPAPPRPSAAPAVSPVRFRNAEPISRVDDRARAPKPSGRPYLRHLYMLDLYVTDPLDRALRGRPSGRAANTNALDEVPSGSWFENRAGRGDLPPEALRRGPEVALPLEVLGTKVGGLTPGLLVRDARGTKYILKFDERALPEASSAADVITQRLLWAAGYHTPRDGVVSVDPRALRIAPRAEVKDLFGVRRPMTEADLDEVLAAAAAAPDGTRRALVSEYLPGAPVGGYAHEGVRPDDPNDLVPHEERREQRGAYVFFSWLNHVDVKEDNTLDMWHEDPARPGRGHLRHHLVDFGSALGVLGMKSGRSIGFAHLYDGREAGRALASFGLQRRPWESIAPADLRGVGLIESEAFDPGAWRPRFPWAPFDRVDAYDAFWGAKILARLSPAHVRVAVEEGRLSDPRARSYLVETLLARREKILRHHFARTNPLDRFTVEAGPSGAGGATVCFDDLWRQHVDPAAPTIYRVTAAGFVGRPLARVELRAEGGRACALVPTGTVRDSYTIVAVSTGRPGHPAAARPVEAHIAQAPDGRLRVIGVHRE